MFSFYIVFAFFVFNFFVYYLGVNWNRCFNMTQKQWPKQKPQIDLCKFINNQINQSKLWRRWCWWCWCWIDRHYVWQRHSIKRLHRQVNTLLTSKSNQLLRRCRIFIDSLDSLALYVFFCEKKNEMKLRKTLPISQRFCNKFFYKKINSKK